jgi:hypothetical protein
MKAQLGYQVRCRIEIIGAVERISAAEVPGLGMKLFGAGLVTVLGVPAEDNPLGAVVRRQCAELGGGASIDDMTSNPGATAIGSLSAIDEPRIVALTQSIETDVVSPPAEVGS